MTIFLYSGTPGSGKSLHATRDIRDYLKYKKKTVIANYEVKTDANWQGDFNYFENSLLEPGRLCDFARNLYKTKPFREDSILLVIDEAQLIFNSRTWADFDRLSWIKFFSQHRKFGYKIIFIAQSSAMIDKQIRAVIEYEIEHRKLANFGRFGFIADMLTFGPWFIAIKRFFSMNERLSCEWVHYSKRLCRMYNSYKSFEDSSGSLTASGLVPEEVSEELKPDTLQVAIPLRI